MIQPNDPGSGPGQGLAEEQVAAGSGIRISAMTAQIAGTVSLRGDSYVSALLVGGSPAFDFELANVTPPDPALPCAHTPAIYVVSANGLAWASNFDVQFRVYGEDLFGQNQVETTPIIRLSGKKSAFIYTSKVFSRVTRCTIRTHSLTPTNGAFFTIGTWPVWDSEKSSAETQYVGRLHMGIGLPMRLYVDPDRKESTLFSDVKSVILKQLTLGAPSVATVARLRATRDTTATIWGGFQLGDVFLNSSAAHGTQHPNGDLTDVIGGRWEGGMSNKLRLVRRVTGGDNYTILTFNASSILLDDNVDTATVGFTPALLELSVLMRSSLGTGAEGAYLSGNALVS